MPSAGGGALNLTKFNSSGRKSKTKNQSIPNNISNISKLADKQQSFKEKTFAAIQKIQADQERKAR